LYNYTGSFTIFSYTNNNCDLSAKAGDLSLARGQPCAFACDDRSNLAVTPAHEAFTASPLVLLWLSDDVSNLNG
jgi:hypothetical protein